VSITGSAPANDVKRLLGSFVVVLGGLLVLRTLFGELDAVIVVWVALGAGAGAVAGLARRVWVVLPAAAAFYPATVALGLAGHLGPFWYLQAAFAFAVVGSGFGIGATIGQGRWPWRAAIDAWSRASRSRRAAVGGTIALAVAVLAGYVTYAGVRGSGEFLQPPNRDPNCTTPAQAYGWAYEAINYDPADDARLASANPDPSHCTTQGATAGSAVKSPDGVPIAGWYIPAGDGAGPTDPTIVLVHGWHGNKSGMLAYAEPLHASFNLVLIDLRDNGRSGAADVTMGLRERLDLEAMIDWLEQTKHPRWLGALGNSMGGATVLAAAASDQRIRAVLLESTHASLITSGGNIIENEHGFPAQPSGWATITFVSVRLGADVTAIDPERTISRLGDRPVLIVHGTADLVDYPVTSAAINLQTATGAGVPAQLVYCPGGVHGQSVIQCPDLWSRSANAFFGGAAGLP
jgi:pimeloyl-ACP methyl ester carboxylesterase